jgi:hypothetical protein
MLIGEIEAIENQNDEAVILKVIYYSDISKQTYYEKIFFNVKELITLDDKNFKEYIRNKIKTVGEKYIDKEYIEKDLLSNFSDIGSVQITTTPLIDSKLK